MRVFVAFSSSRHLDQHLAGLSAFHNVECVEATGDWGEAVTPSDAIVVDYFSEREQIAVAAQHGAAWLHILSSGVDGFDLGALTFPVVTCSRGISDTPIAEWVMAMILAHE